MSAQIHTNGFDPAAWCWEDWLQVAAGRMGVFRVSAAPRLPDEVACLTLSRLPTQAPGELLHKGGWLSSPRRSEALASLRRLGWAPEEVADAVARGRVLPGPVEEAAERLAAVEADLCARKLSGGVPGHRRWVAIDTGRPGGGAWAE